MKRLIWPAILVVICAVIGFTQSKPAPPPLSDKAKLEIRDEQLAVANLQAKANIIAQKYLDALNNDRDFRSTNEDMQQCTSRLNQLIDAARKDAKVDDSFILDSQSLIWKPKPSPTP